MQNNLSASKLYYDLSLGIKPQPKILLDISSHLLYIEKMFESKQYIMINGIAESGKTVIASEFTRSRNCFSIFFSKYNKGEFNLDYLLVNLIPQISNYLGIEVNQNDFSNENFRRLQNKVRTNKKDIFYFVIDGLEHSTNPAFIYETLDLLNLDVLNFRFLFTDNDKIVKTDIFKELSFCSNNVIGFGINEIKIYFKEFELFDKDIKTIHSFSNGIPSRLKIIKERLEINKDFNSLEIEDKFENWLEQDIEKDLKKIQQSSIQDYNVFIALISLSDGDFTLEDVAVGFEQQLGDVEILFNSLNRIFIIENSKISFTSNNYKEVFKKKYSLLQETIRNIEIKINLEQPQIKNKVRLLELLFNEKSYDTIVSTFDDNFIVNAFSQIQNISEVNNLIDKICKSSYYLNKNEDLFNYSVQGSIINDIENDIENENKILSLISLQEYEKSIIITDLLISKKNKLLYYVKIAKHQKDKKKIIDEILLDKIDSIFTSLKLADYGENLHEIVSDLISISSKYALQILNMGDSDEKSNINELLFTKLTLAALNENDSKSESKNSDIISKIDTDRNKEINTALRLFIGKYSFERLREEILNYKDEKERVKLYRFWLENTEDVKNIDIVISDVVDEIINIGSNDIFNLEILSEISKHIYKIEKNDVKLKLAERFKNLLNKVEDNGLFINKTTFNLNLFNCYYNKDYNNEESVKILENLLLEINDYPDILIRCEALMLVLEYIFDKINYLAKIKFKVKDLFIYNFDKLLLETSDQYLPIKKILKSISKTNFEFCNLLISKLNTSFTRDKSRIYIIDNYLNLDYLKINIDSILIFSSKFEKEYFNNIVSRLILERFSNIKNLSEHNITKLNQVCLAKNNNLNLFNKIHLKILLLKIYHNSNESKKFNGNISKLKKQIAENLEGIQDSYKKNNFCQFLSSKISDIDKAFAKEIFSKNTSEDLIIYNNLRYKISLLLIRNFEAIVTISKENSTAETLENISIKFKKLVERVIEINDFDDRLELLTRLGFICYLNDLEKEAKEIYHYVFESLNLVISKEPVLEYLNSLTFIYLFNQSFIITNANLLPNMLKEELYFNLCNFYLFKQNPFDLYNFKNSNFNSNFSDISNCLTSLENMKFDANINSIVEKISKINKKNLNLPTIQINEITDKVNTIINAQLPDQNNIIHDGYKIISKIRFQKLYKKFNIKDIKNEIDNISNISDRIFVKGALLDEFATFKSPSFSKESLYNEIIEDFKSLNNNYEFISRVNDLSEIMFKVANNKRWKELVYSAFDLSVNLENKVNSYKCQNRIIDTIYKLDEDLAKELVSKGMLDSKKSISRMIVEQYNDLKEIDALSARTEILDDKVNIENYTTSIIENLKDINSNLVKAKKIIDIKGILIAASKLPLDKSIIMYEYYFKNISLANYSRDELIKIINILNENIESIFKSNLIINSIEKIKESKSTNLNENIALEDNSIIIKGTERNKATEIFKNFIIEEAEDFLYIIDPYFTIKDVDFLFTIHKCDKNIDIKVLCCKVFSQDEILNEWKTTTKDEINNCEIIFSYFKSSNEKPIHDRYILSKSSGLRLGTSINSIGSSMKFSEISKMNKKEVNKLLTEELTSYINGTKKEVNGEKLLRMTYSL